MHKVLRSLGGESVRTVGLAAEIYHTGRSTSIETPLFRTAQNTKLY